MSPATPLAEANDLDGPIPDESMTIEDVVAPPPADFAQNTDSSSRPATTKEIRDLPHVMARIPSATWLLVFLGSAAAFARYGIATPWQNYIQNPPGNPKLPGALDLGEEKATIITDVFTVFLYITPLPIGIISDIWLGPFRTMIICLATLLLGCILLVITALPVSLQHGAGLGGLIASMVLIGSGQGGLQSVMYAFIGDQIHMEHGPMAFQKRDDRDVVVDRNITIQFIFNAYFWGINAGALSLIGTTFLERLSYWSAYLLPTGFLALSMLPIVFYYRSLSSRRSSAGPENPIPRAIHVVLIACRHGFDLSAADPRLQSNTNVPWTSSFINELRRGLRACQVMIMFAIFFLCYSQITNNIISQAGQMELVGISNDTLEFLNNVGVVVLSPIIQSMNNLLRRKGISFGPMRRITAAFLLSAVALGYTAGLQKLIYSRGPCYSYPLECPAADLGDGLLQPNQVNVWLQTPTYVILAAAEILGYVSMTEYAYAEAPANMKAIVQALLQLAVALGYALGTALGPASKNPLLVILYASLAGVMGICAVLHWVRSGSETAHTRKSKQMEGTTRNPRHNREMEFSDDATERTLVSPNQCLNRVEGITREPDGAAVRQKDMILWLDLRCVLDVFNLVDSKRTPFRRSTNSISPEVEFWIARSAQDPSRTLHKVTRASFSFLLRRGRPRSRAKRKGLHEVEGKM